jgi:molybdate transport system substrate-binding protein
MTFRAPFLAEFGLVIIAAGYVCPAQAAEPQSASVRVLASNGMKAVLEELQSQSEHAIGHPLSVEYDSTAALLKKIDAGAPFDVAILTSDAIEDLVKETKAAAGTRADFARSGVGLAVRAGSTKPDIRTAAALKRTLRESASITYARDGASRTYIDKMIERLGLGEETKPKIVLTQGSGPAMASVADGKVAMVMTLMSELLPVHGIDVVGPLPDELENYVSFAAAASVKASQPESAKALIAFLKSSAAVPVYKAKGMEPVRP